MHEQLYNEAIAEAKRFLKAAERLEKNGLMGEVGRYGYYAQGKETAALKRASMDLSRALSSLRRNEID